MLGLMKGRTERFVSLHRWRKCCMSRGVGMPKPAARSSAGRPRPPWQDAGKGDCGKLHGIRERRLMPWSSRTFSSRNRAAGQAQRGRVSEKPQPTLDSSGLDCAQTFLLFVLLLQNWHFFLSPPARRERSRGWRITTGQYPAVWDVVGSVCVRCSPFPSLSLQTRFSVWEIFSNRKFVQTRPPTRAPELRPHVLSSSIRSSQLSRNNSLT